MIANVGGVAVRSTGRGPTVVLLPDQAADGHADVDAVGLQSLETALLNRSLRVIVVDAGDSWYVHRGPTPEWFRDVLRPTVDGPAALVGVGVGGQGALLNGYRRGDQWPVVAAVAPAGDLGRWYGRGTALDAECRDADEARQSEAHLFFNPLSRPASQLIWCDPRDEACYPTAMRTVSKVQSSGVRVAADLEAEAGHDRDSYVAGRSGELADWITAELEVAAARLER